MMIAQTGYDVFNEAVVLSIQAIKQFQGVLAANLNMTIASITRNMDYLLLKGNLVLHIFHMQNAKEVRLRKIYVH